MNWTAAMKEFFGFRPGKGATDFATEIKALTYEDKLEFFVMLKDSGVDCEPPTKPKE